MGNCSFSAGFGKISTFCLSLFMIPSLPPRFQPALPRPGKNQHKSWLCKVARGSDPTRDPTRVPTSQHQPVPLPGLISPLLPLWHVCFTALSPNLFLLWWPKSLGTFENPFQNRPTTKKEKGIEGKVTGKQMMQKTKKKAHTCFRMTIWRIWKKKNLLIGCY